MVVPWSSLLRELLSSYNKVETAALRVGASDTGDAFGIIATFTKLPDDPVDQLEPPITVGFPVLLLVLPNKLLIMTAHDFVKDRTAAGMVRLILRSRSQCIYGAHTIEYGLDTPPASKGPAVLSVITGTLNNI